LAIVQLRDCIFSILDGLAGTAVGPVTPVPMAGDTALATLTSVVLNGKVPALIPVGARFKIAGETDATAVHTVTARTPTTMGPTTGITFSPALGPGTYAASAVLTFESNKLDIKIGTGNLIYSEKKTLDYVLDRDRLDTVRQGVEVPMDLTLDAMLEHVSTGTGEVITPVDAMKGIGGASEFVSSATDKCEPYAVDVQIDNVPACGTAQSENYLFPDFRYDQIDYDFSKGTISIKGKCNATEPVITRGS
jgi:hypothetical protein